MAKWLIHFDWDQPNKMVIILLEFLGFLLSIYEEEKNRFNRVSSDAFCKICSKFCQTHTHIQTTNNMTINHYHRLYRLLLSPSNIKIIHWLIFVFFSCIIVIIIIIIIGKLISARTWKQNKTKQKKNPSSIIIIIIIIVMLYLSN